jgi:hypothetical protein
VERVEKTHDAGRPIHSTSRRINLMPAPAASVIPCEAAIVSVVISAPCHLCPVSFVRGMTEQEAGA